jgi:hypothetical protein
MQINKWIFSLTAGSVLPSASTILGKAQFAFSEQSDIGMLFAAACFVG